MALVILIVGAQMTLVGCDRKYSEAKTQRLMDELPEMAMKYLQKKYKVEFELVSEVRHNEGRNSLNMYYNVFTVDVSEKHNEDVRFVVSYRNDVLSDDYSSAVIAYEAQLVLAPEIADILAEKTEVMLVDVYVSRNSSNGDFPIGYPADRDGANFRRLSELGDQYLGIMGEVHCIIDDDYQKSDFASQLMQIRDMLADEYTFGSVSSIYFRMFPREIVAYDEEQGYIYDKHDWRFQFDFPLEPDLEDESFAYLIRE
jgi:hypothetical protein